MRTSIFLRCNVNLLIVLFLMPIALAAAEYRPNDIFHIKVCFNDENGTGTTNAAGVFAKILYPNGTIRKTIKMQETSESTRPCVWNATFTVPNTTSYGTWAALVNGSVPDDERPSAIVYFDVFPERDSLWQLAIIVMVGGASLLFAFLFAKVDEKRFELKLLYITLSFLFMILSSALGISILNTSGLSTASLNPILRSANAAYQVTIYAFWITMAFITVFFIFYVLMWAYNVAKNVRVRKK